MIARAGRLGQRVTSSPPTTSDSLLASARSIPSPSAATVGTQAGRADDRVEHQVAVGLGDQPHEPVGAAEHLPVGPRLAGPRGRVGVGQRDPADAVAPGLLDQRLPRGRGAQADDLELAAARETTSSACTPIEPGRAEDHEAARHGSVEVAGDSGAPSTIGPVSA